MDQKTKNYLRFVENYNRRLKSEGTSWLGPKALGDVLLQTAKQNGFAAPGPGGLVQPGGEKEDES